MGRLSTPPELSPALDEITSFWKRAVTRAYFVTAGWQRTYARSMIDRWPTQPTAGFVRLDVMTLACERDALELMRMVSSLIRHVGMPRRLDVVSDGTLSQRTSSALRHMCPVARVLGAESLTDPLPGHPLGKLLRDNAFPFALKLLVVAQPPTDVPRLYLDSDIEFFRGAGRFRELIAAPMTAPRYMSLGTFDYDERLTDGLKLLPGANAGFILAARRLPWRLAFDRLAAVAETAVPISEQTAVAIALTQARAEALPEDDYILAWDDLGVPWDPYARRGVVLRHYASPARRWKMWLRGGPSGMRTLPRAVATALFTRESSNPFNRADVDALRTSPTEDEQQRAHPVDHRRRSAAS